MNTLESVIGKVATEELREMVDTMVEEKITSILGDPEDDLEIRDDLKARLLRQREELRNGKKSYSFDEAMNRLGLG